MPKRAFISNRRFFCEARNGSTFALNTSDFATDLLGNVGDLVQALWEVQVEWFANASTGNDWILSAGTIERTTGNFFDDGFEENQAFEFFNTWGGTRVSEYTATIDAISTDGLVLTYSVDTGAPSSTGTQNDVGIRALCQNAVNYLTGVGLEFGLLENGDTFNNLNRATGTGQGYTGTGIGLGGPRATTFVDLNPVGPVLDWQTGSARARFVSDTTYSQTFEIEHTFRITPSFIDGQLSALKAGTPPSYLSGTSSLKYAYGLSLRFDLSNPNRQIVVSESNRIGNVGWYNEAFNGGPSDYTAGAVSYVDTTSLDAVDGLQLLSRTRATFTLTKASGSFTAGDRIGVFLSALPFEANYTGGTETQTTNFGIDSLFAVIDTGAVVGTGLIKSLNVTTAGAVATVVAEIEYNSIEASRFNDSQGYLIAGTADDGTLGVGDSGRASMLADVREFITSGDVSGLMRFERFNFLFGKEEAGVDTGATDFDGWPQDGLCIDYEFALELDTAKAAFLNTLRFRLVAYNSTTEDIFDLDSYEYALGSTVSGGSQQIEASETRGFPDSGRATYNLATITTGAKVGTEQFYSGFFAFKLRWEDWLLNPDASTVFFDASKPNNGLNFFSPDFSGASGYEVRAAVSANLSGLNDFGQTVATDYLFLSPALSSSDWGTNSDWSISIATLREATLTDTGGAVLVGEDTRIRATFDYTPGAITDLSDVEVFIRIQKANGEGQQVTEASDSAIAEGGILKPITGASFVSLSLSGGDVVADVLIDGSLTEAGGYFISARIVYPEALFVLFEDEEAAIFEDSQEAQFEDQ